MTKKEKFINVVSDLFRKTDMPTFAGEDYDDVMVYFEALKGSADKEKPAFTENGKLILSYIQQNKDTFNNLFKAKDIADGIGITSRTVSGAMRKLVTDGYVEKLGESPVTYSLTDKGLSITFE